MLFEPNENKSNVKLWGFGFEQSIKHPGLMHLVYWLTLIINRRLATQYRILNLTK